MAKLNNSHFERIEDILKSLDIKYDEKKNNILEELSFVWIETIGNKISKFSKVNSISADNVLIVACTDSIVASELYKEELKILELMNKKITKLGIELKGIKFDYRKWKDKND